jgi:hypothetical protein
MPAPISKPGVAIVQVRLTPLRAGSADLVAVARDRKRGKRGVRQLDAAADAFARQRTSGISLPDCSYRSSAVASQLSRRLRHAYTGRGALVAAFADEGKPRADDPGGDGGDTLGDAANWLV